MDRNRQVVCVAPADEIAAQKAIAAGGGWSGDDDYDPAAGGTPEASWSETDVVNGSNTTVEAIVEQVKALSAGDLARLDAELSELRRKRMRALTAAARERTRDACEREISDAVRQAVQTVRGQQPT